MWKIALLIALPFAALADSGMELRRSLNDTPHGWTMAPDPDGDGMVERFEVRPGDCGENGGWSDCRSDRERSEMAERRPRAAVGEEVWYGFSFYLPKDWPDVWPTKTTIAQFHQHRSHVVWMLQNKNGALRIDDQSAGTTRALTEIIPTGELLGRWRRIEVFARWSDGPDGVIRWFLDGDMAHEVYGANMTGAPVYFKYGVYRSFISRHGHPVPTQIAYFRDVSRAATRAGLR